MFLDTKFLADNLAAYKASLKKRGLSVNIDHIIAHGEKRKSVLVEIEKLRSERNKLTENLKEKPPQQIIDQGRTLKEKIQEREQELEVLELELNELLLKVPNLVSDESPLGSEENKKVLKTWGEPTEFNFTPLDHEQLGQKLSLIDFERGTKVTGSKFYFLKNEAVLLEFALVRFAFDFLLKEGFIPVIPPEIIKDEILVGMGFQPRGPETQVYGVEGTNLSLIGTAEHSLGGLHAHETLEEKSLPLKYAGFSSCFRTEAGGYGKFSKGLYRVHQFDKIEMFIYSKPSGSEEMHKYLLQIEEKIWQSLEIPYRVVDLATEDMGMSHYRDFDIEAWMPGRDKGNYSEVTSTSNTTDFQSRRLNIRYRDKDGKLDLVHMLNGTAIAISRALIVILENHQQKDGSVVIPQALAKYCGFEKITAK